MDQFKTAATPFLKFDTKMINVQGRPNLPALTSLRFIAALLVLIFHYRHKEAVFSNGVSGFGYEAVAFFFILSGFILTYTYTTPRGLNVSVRDFFVTRIARIAPSYYLALAITLPIFLVKGPWGAAPFVLTMTQAWVPPSALAWTSPAWSLSNEMFFYLCYPAFYWLALRINVVLFFFFAAALLIATTILRDACFVGQEWHNFHDFFPLFNLPQFALGLALGNLFLRGLVPTHRAMLAAGLVAMVAILAHHEVNSWLKNTILLSAIFSMIILGAAHSYSPILGSAPLYLLGDASYSIYILHSPIGSWWNWATVAFELHPVVDFVLYLVCVIVLSVAALHFVEKPGRRAIKKLHQTFF